MALAQSFSSPPHFGKGTYSGREEGPNGVGSAGEPSGSGEPGREFLVDGIVSAPDVREEVPPRSPGHAEGSQGRHAVSPHGCTLPAGRPYAHQLRLELSLAGLPVAGPDPTTLKDSAAGRLLLGLLNVIEDDFGRSQLMQWLAEAPVRGGPGGFVASAELMHWEALSGRRASYAVWTSGGRGWAAASSRRRKGLG